MSNRSSDVGILGASLGTGNRGVSALGASLVKLVCQAHPEARPLMVIGNRTSQPFKMVLQGKPLEVGVVNFRMSPKARFREHMLGWCALAAAYRCLPIRKFRAFLEDRHPLIRTSARACFVGDIRGGDSFSDIYGLANFLLGSVPVFAILLVRREIVLLPQTYGPYKSPIARWAARRILKRASTILSRDQEGLAMVDKLIGRTPKSLHCPDVAFSLESRAPARVAVEPPLNNVLPSKLVGLNVNGLMYRGGYSRANMFGLKLDYPVYLVQVIKALLADPTKELLLVPHTFAPPDRVESDPQACREVRAKLPAELQTRVHLVEAEYDQNEIKWVIGTCDFFIGSRMHACIAALSQGIPTVGVAYSKKFAGVFETVGASGSVIDGRDITVEEAVSRTMALYAERETIRPRIKAGAEQAQHKLKSVFSTLFASTRPLAGSQEREDNRVVPSFSGSVS